MKKERRTQKMNEARRRLPFTRNNNGCLVALLATGNQKNENNGTESEWEFIPWSLLTLSASHF
jgi:hypothetical protein